jgi:hypothetical protein
MFTIKRGNLYFAMPSSHTETLLLKTTPYKEQVYLIQKTIDFFIITSHFNAPIKILMHEMVNMSLYRSKNI